VNVEARRWRMKIEFRKEKLALILTDRAAETGLPFEVIKSCRIKLIYLEDATDERDLRNWRSLHYEKLKGERDGQRSIRLNDKWRLVFELDEKEDRIVVLVVDVENHYGD
jgi:proteic killer suppression protein